MNNAMPVFSVVFRYLMRGLFLISMVYVTQQMLSPSVPTDLEVNDKVVHFVIFGWLALTLDASRWFGRKAGHFSARFSEWKGMAVALTLYGVALEIGQYFVPGRSMSGLDWLADIAGILAYFCGIVLFKRWISPHFRAFPSAVSRK